jgi:RNA polymerase sigma-70 factor, ECF subfamily
MLSFYGHTPSSTASVENSTQTNSNATPTCMNATLNEFGEIPELEFHRKLIYMLAESQLTPLLRRKLDADDIVQETMHAAYLNFDQVREPDSPLVVKKWLKQILANVLTDQFRRFNSDKRDVNLELSLAANLDNSSAGVERWIAAGHTSPSMAAARNEDFAKLADGLKLLPEDVRDVIIQKHINNKSIKEIADSIGRSTASVAGLLRRGLATLRASFD